MGQCSMPIDSLVKDAVQDGKSVQLLIGLNAVTSPNALREVHELPGIAIRYLTSCPDSPVST